jgi:hypothetical protein
VSLEDEKRIIQSAQRLTRAKLLDQMIHYQNKPDSLLASPYPSSFLATSEYGASASLNDSYDFSFNLKHVPWVDLFFPSTFNFRGSLSTTKNGWQFAQSDSRSFSASKTFDRLMNAVSSGLFKAGGDFTRQITLDADYNYNLNSDYNTKMIHEIHTVGGRTTLRLLRDLTFVLKYDLVVDTQKQALRYSYVNAKSQTNYYPYMGIGVYSGNAFNEPNFGETLNVGSFENIAQINSVGDIGLEKSDLRTFVHRAEFRFNWTEPKPLIIKLFKAELKFPPSTSQTIGINFYNYVYEIPNLNETILKNGDFSPNSQPDPVAAKNLKVFTDPNNSREFTVWSAKTSYGSTFNFSQNFSLTYGISLALINRMLAQTYFAYKKYDYRSGGLPNANNSSHYLRDAEYTQLGIDLSLSGALRF